MLDIVSSITFRVMSLPDSSSDHITILGIHLFDPSGESRRSVLQPAANHFHFWRPVDRVVNLVVIEYSQTGNAYPLSQEFFSLEKGFFDTSSVCHIDSRDEE